MTRSLRAPKEVLVHNLELSLLFFFFLFPTFLLPLVFPTAFEVFFFWSPGAMKHYLFRFRQLLELSPVELAVCGPRSPFLSTDRAV